MSDITPIKKRGNPNWKRGVSGNPSGRPATAFSVAKYISDRTNGCQDIIERLLKLGFDDESPKREMLTSLIELLSRAVGRSAQSLDITTHADPGTAAGGLPSDFYRWPADRRREWLDEYEVKKAAS